MNMGRYPGRRSFPHSARVAYLPGFRGSQVTHNPHRLPGLHGAHSSHSLPCLLGLFTLLALFLAGCETEDSRNEGLLTQDLNPEGWVLLPIDGTLPHLNQPRVDLLLPQAPELVQLPYPYPQLPKEGLIIQSSAPIWTDPGASRILSRVNRGETVQIIREEAWQTDRLRPMKMYEVVDQFQNRGWIQAQDIMIPLMAVSSGSFGIYEVLVVRQRFSPPLRLPQGVAQPLILPLVVWGSTAYALFPESLLKRDLEADPDFHLSVNFEHRGLHGTAELSVLMERSDGGGGSIVSFSLLDFGPSGPSLRQSQARRIDADLVELDLPRLLSQPASWSGRIRPDRAVVYEYSARSEESLSVYRNYLIPNETGMELLQEESMEIASGRLTQNLQSAAALRRGPSQGEALLGRLEVGTELRALRVHLPSTTVAGQLGVWVMVDTLEQESPQTGWIWGPYLEWTRIN